MRKMRWATSLILALANAGVVVLGLACLRVPRFALVGMIAMMAVAPPLAVVTAGFAVRDMLRPMLRWQALLALAICALVIAVRYSMRI